MMYEYDIRNCTNERLAEMLEDPMPVSRAEWYEILHEAAARLRTKHKIPFNNEAFE